MSSCHHSHNIDYFSLCVCKVKIKRFAFLQRHIAKKSEGNFKLGKSLNLSLQLEFVKFLELMIS